MDGSGGGGAAKRLKSQMADTNSISGTIVIQNNCNNSQLSSPDLSEANEMHRYSSSSTNLAMANIGNDDKEDKHRSSLLKIPGVIKAEQQQSVGFNFASFRSLAHLLLACNPLHSHLNYLTSQPQHDYSAFNHSNTSFTMDSVFFSHSHFTVSSSKAQTDLAST